MGAFGQALNSTDDADDADARTDTHCSYYLDPPSLTVGSSSAHRDLLEDAARDHGLATFETLARNGRRLCAPEFLARIEASWLAAGRARRMPDATCFSSENR